MQHSDKANYAAELISNDFLKYADSSKVESLKTLLIDSFNIYNEDNFRKAHIDAEELAEFSFDFFMPGLNRILAKRNITLSVKKSDIKENSYSALINNDTVQLYTQKDLDNDTFWQTASRNFFRKVNEILKRKSSDEQFYLLYNGNDLHVILLTEKQFSIIAEYFKDEPKEIPYEP